MIESYQGTYFGVLDRQMERFISPVQWEQHLLCALLFEQRLVVPDIFFFISHHLSEHLKHFREGTSLFEVALASGRIVAAFRSTDPTFLANLAVCKRQGILGILDDAQHIAKRLDRVVAERFSGMPQHLRLQRTEFASLSQRIIATKKIPDLLPEAGGVLQKVWDRSEPWRIEARQKAEEWTKREDGFGLRRGRWMCEAGWAMGWPRGEDVHDVNSVIEGLRNPEDHFAAECFFRWMNECYQASGAAAMKLFPGFPDSVPKCAIVPYSLLPSGTPEGDQYENLEFTVDIPPCHALLQVSPDKFIGACKEIGREYLLMLEAWRNRDPSCRGDTVEERAHEYARELSRHVYDQTLLTKLEIKLRRWVKPATRDLLQSVLQGVEDLPIVGKVCVSLGRSGWAVYRWLDLRDTGVPIKIQRRTADLVLPPVSEPEGRGESDA